MKLVLLGIAGLLALSLGLQWWDWREPLPPSPEASVQLDQISAPTTPQLSSELSLLRSEEDYIAVVERPLFLPDRRPLPAEAVDVEVPDLQAEIADLAMLDVSATLILSPTEASVWLRDPQQPGLIRLRLGEEYQGWLVAQINADHILLERQGATETLQLLDFSAPPVPVRGPRRPVPSTTTAGGQAPRSPSRRN
ncbi:MAG: hypothetical protein VBE63_00185 [Lamprobacter sp.]|uniref:hypothetical protein n=1 Tax=Lamprobacter sp. TaxID=3100796 RepID=UPI002B25D1FD|nr:hypothetical protein [Lamprobacter sp.]MEA3638344.1 hypothetical protein [Lamprobacter sp.]